MRNALLMEVSEGNLLVVFAAWSGRTGFFHYVWNLCYSSEQTLTSAPRWIYRL